MTIQNNLLKEYFNKELNYIQIPLADSFFCEQNLWERSQPQLLQNIDTTAFKLLLFVNR